MAWKSAIVGGVLGVLLSGPLQQYIPVLLQTSSGPVDETIADPATKQPERYQMTMGDQWSYTALACDVALKYKDHVGDGLSAASLNTAALPSYTVTLYKADSSVQVVNDRDATVWYKRSVTEGVRMFDMFLGNNILVNRKCFTLMAYKDDITQQAVQSTLQSTFAMLKPDAVARAGAVLTTLESLHQKLSIAGARLMQLSAAQARLFYKEHEHRTFFDELVAYITSGPVLLLHLVGPEAVGVWRQALGPTDSGEARRQAPASVRALYGTDKQRNAAHGSDSETAAQREVSFFFSGAGTDVSRLSSMASTAELLDATSCLLLPHVLRAGRLGAALSSLSDDHGCSFTRAEIVRLSYLDAARYASGHLLPVALDQPQLQDLVNELLSGPAMFVQLKPSSEQESSAQFLRRFKDIIGPRDPVRARQTAVESMRAAFGDNRHQSGLLCPFYDWNKQ